MKISARVLLLFTSGTFLVPAALHAQSTLSAPQIACKSWAAITGSLGTQLVGIQLSGSANYTGGDGVHNGTIQLKGSGLTASNVTLSLDNGATIEVRTTSGNSWRDASGTNHLFENSGNPNTWFFPGLLPYFGCPTSQAFSFGTSRGQGDIAVVAQVSIPSTASASQALSQHLSRVEYHLDSSSLLPIAVLFNEHPDSDLGTDIPVEIRFSNYQPLSGVRVPFRIQKLINGAVVLDMTVDSAMINPPFSALDFQTN